MRRRVFLFMLVCVMAVMSMAGCNNNSGNTGSNPTLPSKENPTTTKGDTQETTTPAESITDESTTDESDTVPPVTEEPTTAEPETEKPVYVGAWTLMSQEPLNPKQSCYEELDKLVNELLDKLITDDMNGYKKAWVCYEYLVDNITYSRGMDANTGMYSSSDPAVTPKEVLWATDLFNSGQGCCYHYSAAYVYMLRALGFDAHLVSGNVPAYNGGRTPHCWLYVNMNGNQYIFDPDLDMNYYTREKNQGVENPPKDRFFCVQMDKMSYFYTIETYHTN